MTLVTECREKIMIKTEFEENGPIFQGLELRGSMFGAAPNTIDFWIFGGKRCGK
jgi:hypothetical protein